MGRKLQISIACLVSSGSSQYLAKCQEKAADDSFCCNENVITFHEPSQSSMVKNDCSNHHSQQFK